MWLYFDDTGALIKSLEHGPAARVGTTNFQVFAFFDNLDVYEFNTATIKFIKDDFNTSSHPMLFMNLVRNAPFVLNATNNETEQNVQPFVPGHKYTGFLFDFANFSGGQDVSVLLDTPGKWHAVITLYTSVPSQDDEEGTIVASDSMYYVQGTVEFYVEGPLLETDPYVASLDDLVGNIAREMSVKKVYFVRIYETEGRLDDDKLAKIKDNNLNRLVYNNIVYYYARTIDNLKQYHSIVEQTSADTDLNTITVNLDTGDYVMESILSSYLTDHINNRIVHITQEEREFWNNKVTTESNANNEELILTKN